MNKKKKIIIITLSIIILIIAFRMGYSYLVNKNKKYSSIDDFNNIKELVNYYNCEYKGIKNSKEENYTKDIYIIFSEDPITKDGETNKIFYENLISLISAKMERKDYRIIDENKQLTIRVKFDKEGKVGYTINDYSNYFENLKSLYTINNEKKDSTIHSNIVSRELQNIINNGWIRRNSGLGEKTSTCDNYDIYWNNGYKIKTINNKIYNIIFLNNYQGEVLQGVTTGMTTEDIKRVLGEPTYIDNSEIEVIGYKLDNIYAFFTDGEISVYRLDEFNEEDNKKFASLMTKLNSDKDYNSFLSELTNLYPDYSEYIQESNHINIKYPLRGFESNFGQDANNGITIYNNYQGNITEDISIDDVKNSKKLPANTYLNLERNLVFDEELERLNDELITRDYYDNEGLAKGEFAVNSKYAVYYNKIYKEYVFYSIDKNNPDFEIRVQNATGIYTLTDNYFVYGVTNDGIYVIDTNNMNASKIANDTGNCIIDRIENNVIYYDNTSITLSFN